MIKIITGKGGVGKTTAAAWYALDCSVNQQEIRLVSIDPMHSLADAFSLRKKYSNNPLNENKWVNLWKMDPWKGIKKENELEPAKLYLRRVEPRPSNLVKNKIGISNQIYTGYEIEAAKMIKKYQDEFLIIDTDSLGGLQKLLNYVKESKGLSKIIKEKAEIVPVTTPERVCLAKVDEMMNEPLIREFGLTPKNVLVNHVKDKDQRLLNLIHYSNLRQAKCIPLFEQYKEPLGADLLLLRQPATEPDKSIFNVKSEYLPDNHPIYFVCGKGGQGKSTVACAMAVGLAEQGKKVMLVSADARSSLSHILNEELPFIDGGEEFTYLHETEQYRGLRIAVQKESKFLDHIPGMTFTRAMMRAVKQEEDRTILVIDAPPSGNIIKNFQQGFKEKDLDNKLLYYLDLAYLYLRKKKGSYNYLIDHKRTYRSLKELIRTPDFLAIPVVQPTKTGLVETLNLTIPFYQNEVFPFNLMLEEDHVMTNVDTMVDYAFNKHIVVNKYDIANEMMINEIEKELAFYPESNLTYISCLDQEPIGRRALSAIARNLLNYF